MLLAKDYFYEDDAQYIINIRRELHENPEIGFDLDRTVKLVSGELDRIGIAYTYAYGKGSVVAELGQGEKLIALRADMDALPVEEKTDLPYKSKLPGQMHACGHDSHTAMLMVAAKILLEMKHKFLEKLMLLQKVQKIFRQKNHQEFLF